VTVDVTNTGARAGVEIAQLYLRDEISRVTRPVRELRGFARVPLAPGETRAVSFELGPDALATWTPELKQVIEPGWFTVWVGGSSQATLSARFEVK
jgi:beta-glucosidase